MASPCEILVEAVSHSVADELLHIAVNEAERIEHKFSRYRPDSVVSLINRSNGEPVAIDEETHQLLSYADVCWKLSDGMFDVTSGVLRRVWKFDGSDRIPDAHAVEELLGHIGWEKVVRTDTAVTLPAGMEIDFGGIGKEYAVDTTAAKISQHTTASFVMNYGGDLFVRAMRANGQPWIIGVDDPSSTGQQQLGALRVTRGGVATSGDAQRFLLRDGVRYSHILNPKTGWPVERAPRSVTVVQPTCIEAGIVATMAMLQGERAEEFLAEQHVQGHVVW